VCLSDCDGGPSDYSKQKMNFQESRFPEIARELDSGNSHMPTGWYVSYWKTIATQFGMEIPHCHNGFQPHRTDYKIDDRCTGWN